MCWHYWEVMSQCASDLWWFRLNSAVNLPIVPSNWTIIPVLQHRFRNALWWKHAQWRASPHIPRFESDSSLWKHMSGSFCISLRHLQSDLMERVQCVLCLLRTECLKSLCDRLWITELGALEADHATVLYISISPCSASGPELEPKFLSWE